MEFSAQAALDHAEYLTRLADDCADAGLEGNAQDHRRSAELLRWTVMLLPEEEQVLHPDGSDCDYCTYDKPCIAATTVST